MNFLTPHWEHPACVRCAGCSQPLELTWSSSAVSHKIYHAQCRTETEHNPKNM